MCTHCHSILGRYATPHNSDDCPVLAATHCSYCAVWGVHFSGNCPYRAKTPSYEKPITNPQAKIPEPCRILPEDPVMYIKIINLYGFDSKDSKEENLKLVKEIYASQNTPVLLIPKNKPIVVQTKVDDELPPQNPNKLLKRKLVK